MTKDKHYFRNVSNSVREKLELLTGSKWKEFHLENHFQYKEIPIWILLYDGSDVTDVHSDLLGILAPFIEEMNDYNFTVSYSVFEEKTPIDIDFLSSNEEIKRGYSIGPLGSMASAHEGDFSLFEAKDSKR